MSSIYTRQLPPAFPHRYLTRNRNVAERLIRSLMEAGSSFAVTMDRPITIWLSEASLTVLANQKLIDPPKGREE